MPSISLYATNEYNAAAGYGKMERGLNAGLEAAGVQVCEDDSGDVAILTGKPTWAMHYPHPRLWSYTMSESTKVSAEWVDCLNLCYERVLVPCPPLVEIYKASGVTIPVHYVPLGVDTTPIKWRGRNLDPERVTIMTYSLGDMRKNAQDAMLSWHRLFGDDERYELVIKCRDNPMWLTNCVQPRVTVVRGEQSEADYQALMNRAAVFVFPSRGEGFGYPPREAVLMGIPTIATQWMGMWDADRWAFPVSVLSMWPSQFSENSANAPDSEWVNISRTHLDEQLRWIINNYDAALDHTWKGREYLLKHFTWQRTAADILDILNAA